MSRTIISGLKTGPLVFWIGLIAVIGAYALYADFTGPGLQETIFYHVLGSLIYPVFYGAALISLFQIGSMALRRNDYVYLTGDWLAVGRKKIPRGDVQSVSVRHTSLVEELVIQRRDGSDVVVRAYMLSRPALDVLADLQRLLFKVDAPPRA